MREGRKIRVKADNRIGVVVETKFFMLGGKKIQRVLVKFDEEKEPIWLDKSEVTDKLIETIDVTFSSDEGKMCSVAILLDHSSDKLEVSLDGEAGSDFLRSKSSVAYLVRRFLMGLAGPSFDK